MAGGGQSGGGSQTVTQTKEIPEWQKDYAIQNEQIASSLASRPYPTYEGQLIAGFSPLQNAGMNMAANSATAYQPDLYTAEGMTAGGAQGWSPQAAQQYMSPYAMAALAPQMQALGLQQAQQQKGIDAGATQAGAFGDARHGVAQGMNDFYGNLAMNDLVSQGMNSAYNSGMSAFQNDQSRLLGAGQQMAGLAGQQQQQGLAGADALFGAGGQQQALTQQQLDAAYKNFQNQFNYPADALNMRIAALTSSPYSTVNTQSLSPGSTAAQNIGGFSALAGGLGSLMGSNNGVFGGVKTQ